MRTFKRTALAIAVTSIMLVAGACSSDSGSDGTTTTTVATATTKPGTKPVGKPNAQVVAYCKAFAAQKGKYDLKSAESATKGLPYIKAIATAAPAAIKADVATIQEATTEIAAIDDAKAFAAEKKAILSTPEVKKSYGRLLYFNRKNCK